MTLRYHILKSDTREQGFAEFINLGWATIIDGRPIFTPPSWIDIIRTAAYSVVGEYDEEGETITPAITAEGAWYMISVQDVELPVFEDIEIVASWNYGEEIEMPEGVVTISPILSGATI